MKSAELLSKGRRTDEQGRETLSRSAELRNQLERGVGRRGLPDKEVSIRGGVGEVSMWRGLGES